MLSGKFPFKSSNLDDLKEQVKNNEVDFKKHEEFYSVSVDAKDFILKCLQK